MLASLKGLLVQPGPLHRRHLPTFWKRQGIFEQHQHPLHIAAMERWLLLLVFRPGLTARAADFILLRIARLLCPLC